MKSISSLMAGYRVFRSQTFPANRGLYRELVERGLLLAYDTESGSYGPLAAD